MIGVNRLNTIDISVFYTKEMWHKVLIEVITPFLLTEKNIDEYYVRLSDKRGSHIQLILMTEKKYKKAIVHNIDKCLKKYIRRKPSLQKENLISENRFFLNFKNNSVHYGIIDNIIIHQSNIFKIYHRTVSFILIEIFNQYKERTLYNIVEIMMELLIIFYYSIPNNREVISLLDSMLQHEYKRYKPETIEKIKKTNNKNYKNNKDLVHEYFIDNHPSSIINIQWKKCWAEAVRSCSNHICKAEPNKVQENYSYMILYLFTSFDFKERTTVLYMVSKAIKYNQFKS